MFGVDLAKRVFQLHGARCDGSLAFRKKLSRGQLLAFKAQQSLCMIAVEACATVHGWGREFEGVGHGVRLILPIYVKPFVKRQKNDVANAEGCIASNHAPCRSEVGRSAGPCYAVSHAANVCGPAHPDDHRFHAAISPNMNWSRREGLHILRNSRTQSQMMTPRYIPRFVTSAGCIWSRLRA
jgi:hypothetical protein